MRILVQGCGGIGGVVAAHLARAGAHVDVVTGTPELATTLREDGLQVRDVDGTQWTARLPGQIDGELRPAGEPYDVCLLATQGTVLPAALQASAPRLAPDGVVVCFQNGLP